METSTHHSFNYSRIFGAHRHRLRITPVIGLIFMALVFAEASAYLRTKPSSKTFDHTENDLDAITERPAYLWTERASHKLSGTPARISPAAAKQAFFTHLLDQGRQQMQRQEFAQALNSFEKALALDSRDPALYYLLAELHRTLGRYELSDQFREVGDTPRHKSQAGVRRCRRECRTYRSLNPSSGDHRDVRGASRRTNFVGWIPPELKFKDALIGYLNKEVVGGAMFTTRCRSFPRAETF